MSTATQTASVTKSDLEVLAAHKGMGTGYVASMIQAGLSFQQLHSVLAAMTDKASGTAKPVPPAAAVKPAVFANTADEIAWYRAENERLKAKQSVNSGKLTCKVSEKGALSIYGMGRFPVTLYRQQWERLLSAEQVTAIKAFITANTSTLVVKE